MNMKVTRKIRVALFADVLKENTDGVTYTWYNIIDRIPKNRFEFIFITPYPPSEQVKLPFPVVVCPAITLPFNNTYKLGFPFFNSKLKKILKDFNPDMIHYTTPSLLGIYATKYAKKNNLPLFSTYHTHFASYIEYVFRYVPALPKLFVKISWVFARWFYNKCDLVYVPTKPIMEEMVENGIEKERLFIWGRGVNTKRFTPDKKDREYINRIAGENTKRLLFVSRIVWEKELKTLIKIYDYFKETRPDIKLILVGDGPQKKAMEKRMPGAIFTGSLIKDELAKMYASCDVFIFPSVTETFGNVIQEAMSSGLPSVVAAKGGPMGIIKNGINGYLARPKDHVDFCWKILYLLDNKDLARKLSENGVIHAKTQRWDNLCDILFNSYEKILAAKRFRIGELHEVTV